MKLSAFEIANFRAIERANVTHLGKFNALVGRNNSGKSSLFVALQVVGHVVGAFPVPVGDWEATIPVWNPSGSLEVLLTLRLDEFERAEFTAALGVTRERSTALIGGPFARQLTFLFRAPAGQPALLHLRETKLLTEDGAWALIQAMPTDQQDTSSNPVSRLAPLDMIAQGGGPLTASTLNVASSGPLQVNRQVGAAAYSGLNVPAGAAWPLQSLLRYFQQAFFFSPFRHSESRQTVAQATRLAPDGANLAQMLHTINSNDRHLFGQIEKFMQDALPGIGALQPPLLGNQTEVGFRTTEGRRYVRIHDMGGGVEQLLMIATVLLTTGDESTVFLEEPESHIHPGAQRFLIDQLYRGERQVFTATHSPVFVNVSQPKTIHRVALKSGRSQVHRVTDPDTLETVLNDIGARNSDVLMSDAIVFVEGPGDKLTLSTWSENLATGVGERNINIFAMGGGEQLARSLPVRSDVLTAVSLKSEVPHLFILDRDERSSRELVSLEEKLAGKVHIWQRREIENYLLHPRAIIQALLEKYRDNAPVVEKVSGASEEEIGEHIRRLAGELFGIVLLKRIRAELGGLSEGLLSREAAKALASAGNSEDLAAQIRSTVEAHVGRRLHEAQVETVAAHQHDALSKEWQDESRRLFLVPGQELLEGLYEHFGGRYEKPQDTVRIARLMLSNEIDSEVAAVLERVLGLPLS